MLPCEVIDLKKYYNGSVVGVESANFSLKEGEIFGLVGPNGAGKSTTLRAIAGLLRPTSGKVAIFNKTALKAHEERVELGYVPYEPSFYGRKTVRQNLEFVSKVRGVGMDRVDELATRLELNLTRRARDLSAGNKKKLSIVIALMSSPKLIVLDEPTTGLDPIIKKEFLKILEEEKKRGASILISSHDLGDIQRLCDRVGIIKDGKLIAIEQTGDLKTKRLKTVSFDTEYSTPIITLSGVSNLVQEGRHTTFNYNGDMKKLINYLNSVDVTNIDIGEASLENIFLHFYE